MITVGITGSYASGKTFVLDYLRDLGYKTFSADKIVDALYGQESIRKKILELLTPLEEFDKGKIAKLIYNNLKWRKFLQGFIHPLVVEELRNFKKANKDERIIFAEIPLLFESNIEQYVDFTVTIYCSELARLKRARLKENFSKENYDRISEIQLPQNDKIKRSNFSINTEEEPDIIKDKINQLIKDIM